MDFVARFRQSDGTAQSLSDHLEGSARLASLFASKVGLPKTGELMGLLHDLGKYSDAFQAYLKSAQGKIEPEDEEYVDAAREKGKIDHSTAGAQYVWAKKEGSPSRQLIAELVALCIASHHSGLIDCLSAVGDDVVGKRLAKAEDRAHFAEVAGRIDEHVRRRVESILAPPTLEDELQERLLQLVQGVPSQEVRQFLLGLLARFLFSALVDADRLNSAERDPASTPPWPRLREELETYVSGFAIRNQIDASRGEISSSCLAFAEREKGLYQLTVPTGGGKTLASLRFALRHAEKHQMDRIVYVVPYTSIIDQNARVARAVFSDLERGGHPVVLEHHSNLTPERDTAENKLLAENWDAPIVYTTAVQLLETLFGSGTRGVRRFHQLANAVVIFDEVQTIPIRTVHLFNNAVNFLTRQCGSTVVFCTATQPLLDKVEPRKGAAILAPNAQMVPGVDDLFRRLRRVDVEDRCKPGGWTEEEVADAAMGLLDEAGSVLIVVNKKAQARNLFQRLQGRAERVHHLSTSMCPAHRMKVLDEVKRCLDPADPSPVICVSTQLIEAGVDVDFGSAIRYLAGLDSVAQTAGRCNRNGLRSLGRVLVVNPADENLDRLPDIQKAQEVTLRVLGEYRANPAAFDHDLQGPAAMERFYFYYFYGRKHEMVFPVASREIGREGDLLSLLSDNREAVEAHKATVRKAPPYLLRQSFMTAAEAFRAIDSETEGVIVPYGQEGERLIAELCSASQVQRKFELLKAAQRYSVNLFPHEVRKLKEMSRLHETWDGSGIYYLDERHYSAQFGASTDEVSEMKVLIG
ncbi:MAG: CRISPR-associated helicase Cas3' [Thermodesulfobacteriota bacterium]